MWWLPLPPTERAPAFEPLDALTVALLIPAIVLVCGVLNEGSSLWWVDTPWLGWALAASVVLFALAIMIERYRARPLIQIGWISSRGVLRFAAVAFLVRISLAEQTYGAVGFLAFGGLNNDQLHSLFVIVLAATVFGMLTSAVTLSPTRLLYQIMTAALIVSVGAWLDSQGDNLTRATQLYCSQALIAFGTSLFVGPALLYGFIRMVERGSAFFVSFVVLFSLTQNVGSLAGSALLSSYQFASARYHAQTLSERLVPTDPQVLDRIQSGTIIVADALTDPELQRAQGGALLAQAEQREAAVLAFNDVFRLVAVLALSVAVYVCYLIALENYRRHWKSFEAVA
jgi:hypothetical protein